MLILIFLSKILFDKIKLNLKLFFDFSNYSHNKSYEKFVTKFLIYVYLYISSMLILTVNAKNEEELNLLDYFLNIFDEFTSIFFKFSEVKIIIDFHSTLR